VRNELTETLKSAANKYRKTYGAVTTMLGKGTHTSNRFIETGLSTVLYIIPIQCYKIIYLTIKKYIYQNSYMYIVEKKRIQIIKQGITVDPH